MRAPAAPHANGAPAAQAGPPVLAQPGDTVDAVRQAVQRLGPGARWELVCVVDAQQRLLGTLTAADLLALPGSTPVAEAMQPDAPRVTADTDPEHMASMALHHRLAALPVVDAHGRVVGVVGPTVLMDTLRREHVSDLHRLAGIAAESRQARRALEEPPLRRVRHRLPWLLVGLGGSLLATLVVARFEAAIAERTALAFFVPGLVYLADAIGTQTEAVAVRGLSISRMGAWRLIGGELRSGLLIGLVLAVAVLPMVWLAFGDPRLALAVSLALAAASTVASLLGMLLPWALHRRGLDPAYGSGPLATIIQDVLTLVIYFLCAALILR